VIRDNIRRRRIPAGGVAGHGRRFGVGYSGLKEGM
jgi:hypothetical protein